jgi:hypothetical protein
MIKRNIQKRIITALKDSPVVFLNGARQTGKSTLIREIVETIYPARYVTFDEVTVLSGAKSDPDGFLKNITFPIAIDEVQRAPEFFLAIKAEVDRVRKPGRFILTGSANVLLLPRLADSLAGRMEIISLWPFSQGELDGVTETFVDTLFSDASLSLKLPLLNRPHLLEKILSGGYPESLTRENTDRRDSWFGSYITTILQRDVRDLARIEGLTTLPKLLSLLAARSTTLLNIAEISNSAAIPQTSLKRYLTLLETIFLIKFLPAWSSNLGKQLIKTPKVILSDTGLLAHLTGVQINQLNQGNGAIGPLFENFVAMEITKQITWSHTQPQLFHFRTLRGQEVDLLLEDRKRRIVGIEVKASSTVTANDFKNLKILSEIAGKKFHLGIVIYTGSEIIPFGKDLYAVPVQGLWKL